MASYQGIRQDGESAKPTVKGSKIAEPARRFHVFVVSQTNDIWRTAVEVPAPQP
jgi:hypothetical protein